MKRGGFGLLFFMVSTCDIVANTKRLLLWLTRHSGQAHGINELRVSLSSG